MQHMQRFYWRAMPHWSHPLKKILINCYSNFTIIIIKCWFCFFFLSKFYQTLKKHYCHSINWFTVCPLPQACRRFCEPSWNEAPCERKEREQEARRQPKHADCGEHTFLILVFWACVSREPWQPSTEGRKICAPPGRAPSLWHSCSNSPVPWQKQHSTSKWWSSRNSR